MAVKMFLTRGQFAWGSHYCLHQRLHVERPLDEQFNFNWWLVGFTDGDGTFSVSYQSKVCSFTFKISQSNYNIRALYFIKKQLNVGRVTCTSDNMAHYRIRDRKHLKEYIFPLFDNYPLMTSKLYSYKKFKKIFFLVEDSNLSEEEKNEKIERILSEKMPKIYSSPFFRSYPLKRSWLAGFVEAEGSFYITKKESSRYVHGFGITQKLDKIVLEQIANILGIPTRVQFKLATKTFSLDTTNSRSLENIRKYFKNFFKGMKAVEFKIWSRSFRLKGNYEELYKIQQLLKKLRSKRLNVQKDDGIVRTI